MRRSDNRLGPPAAIAAMLAASTTIVGLVYWAGDAIVPALAAVVQVSSAPAASPYGAVRRVAPAGSPADSAPPAAASVAARDWVLVRRDASAR